MRIPYRRRPSPVPNATNGRKEKSIACSECHNCQKRGAQCKKRSPGCRRPLGGGLSQDVPIYKKSTLHRCKVLFGAENGARTRDLNLGKVALYQLSYFRNITPYLAVGITKVRSFF